MGNENRMKRDRNKWRLFRDSLSPIWYRLSIREDPLESRLTTNWIERDLGSPFRIANRTTFTCPLCEFKIRCHAFLSTLFRKYAIYKIVKCDILCGVVKVNSDHRDGVIIAPGNSFRGSNNSNDQFSYKGIRYYWLVLLTLLRHLLLLATVAGFGLTKFATRPIVSMIERCVAEHRSVSILINRIKLRTKRGLGSLTILSWFDKTKS